MSGKKPAAKRRKSKPKKSTTATAATASASASLTPIPFQLRLLIASGWAKRAAKKRVAQFAPLPQVHSIHVRPDLREFVVCALDAVPLTESWTARVNLRQEVEKLRQLLQHPPANRLQRRHQFSQYLQLCSTNPVVGTMVMLMATMELA